MAQPNVKEKQLTSGARRSKKRRAGYAPRRAEGDLESFQAPKPQAKGG